MEISGNACVPTMSSLQILISTSKKSCGKQGQRAASFTSAVLMELLLYAGSVPSHGIQSHGNWLCFWTGVSVP